MRSRRLAHPLAIGTLVLCVSIPSIVLAQSRLDVVRKRGTLVCGVTPGVSGFAAVDKAGRYSGLDVDICRAVAAAIFGTADKVRFTDAGTVDGFLKSPDVDMVSRRLTWSLQREAIGLLFGPVTFYDGQGFLVPRALKAMAPRDLANRRICIVPGTVTELQPEHLLPVAEARVPEGPAPLARPGGRRARHGRLPCADRRSVGARIGPRAG